MIYYELDANVIFKMVFTILLRTHKWAFEYTISEKKEIHLKKHYPIFLILIQLKTILCHSLQLYHCLFELVQTSYFQLKH